MKKILFICGLMVASILSAQKNDDAKVKNISELRKAIEKAEITRLNKDWSLTAEFKSGIGEVVQFYPVQLVDLKTKEKIEALQIELEVKTRGALPILGAAVAAAQGGNTAIATQAFMNDGKVVAWVDKDEVSEFISFIEQHIIPNLDLKYKEKSSEFIFNAREITLKFLVYEKTRRLTIILNGYDRYQFWTESRAEKIPDLLPILKKVQSKELEF